MSKANYKCYGNETEQKDRMKEDIQGLFKAREYLSRSAMQNVLDEISWKYTETGIDKNLSAKYWSNSALAQYISTGSSTKGLIHEHVVPRDVFIKSVLKKLDDKSISGLSAGELKMIDDRLIACIVTETENKKLPPKAWSSGKDFFDNTCDLWDRYRSSKGMTIHEVEFNKTKKGIIKSTFTL